MRSPSSSLDDHERRRAVRARLDRLAWFMDNAVTLPGTRVGVGADALLNLIPGAGTVAAQAVAAYLVWEAARLGAPPRTLLRMVGNLAADTLISAIPLAGWVGDVFFRANLRNMALLRKHLDGAPDPEPARFPNGPFAQGPVIEGEIVAGARSGR